MQSQSPSLKNDRNGSAPGHDETKALIRRNLESIKAEIAAGTKIDPGTVKELEDHLKQYEANAAESDGRSQ